MNIVKGGDAKNIRWDEPITLVHGDCLEVMPHIPSGSVDAIICDPPYG